MTFGLTLGLGGKHAAASGAGFSPDTIPDMVLWLDASDISTIVQIAGSVSQWSDKSGNANHATQSVAASQPISGTRTINGCNALDFDGSNDYFDLPSSLYSLTEGENHVFIVFNRDTLAAEHYPFWGNGGSNAWGFKLPSEISVQQGRHGTGFRNTGIISDHNEHILEAHRQGIVHVLLDNNNPGFGNANSFTLSNLYVGRRMSGMMHNGMIAEVLVYRRSLSPSERQDVFDYLQEKWGTP